MRRCQGQVFMNVAQIWTDYLKEKNRCTGRNFLLYTL